MSLFIIFFVSTKIDIILGNDIKYEASKGEIPSYVDCDNIGYTCDVICDVEGSCDDLTINSTADDTNIKCSETNSCHYLSVFIGTGMNEYESVDIQCDGENSCRDSNIEIKGIFSSSVKIEIKEEIVSRIYCDITGNDVCKLICDDNCESKTFICSNTNYCKCDGANCNIMAETISPTQFPSNSPIMEPIKSPSKSPTNNPSRLPTKTPVTRTILPSQSPTTSPSKSSNTGSKIFPSQSPTELPSFKVTNNPTIMATQTSVSISSTILPSKAPTYSIIKASTILPSQSPTNSPSQSTTELISTTPTNNITTGATTTLTTKSPSQTPTHFPSAQLPSHIPTITPTTLSIDNNFTSTLFDSPKISVVHVPIVIWIIISLIILIIIACIIYLCRGLKTVSNEVKQANDIVNHYSASQNNSIVSPSLYDGVYSKNAPTPGQRNNNENNNEMIELPHDDGTETTIILANKTPNGETPGSLISN